MEKSNFINLKTKRGKLALLAAISTLGATSAIISSYYILKKDETFWDKLKSMNFILGDEPGINLLDKKNNITPNLKAQETFLSSHFASEFEKGNDYWQNVLMLKNIENKSPRDLANQDFYLVNDKNMPFFALSEQFSKNRIRKVSFNSFANDISGTLFLQVSITYKQVNNSKELNRKFNYQINGFKKFKDFQHGSAITKELQQQEESIFKIDFSSDVSKYIEINNYEQLKDSLLTKSILQDPYENYEIRSVKIDSEKIILDVIPKINYKNYYLVNNKLEYQNVSFEGIMQKVVLDFKKYNYLKSMSKLQLKIKPINKTILELQNTFFDSKFQHIKIYDNYKDEFPNEQIELELDRSSLSSIISKWDDINNSKFKITQNFKEFDEEFGYASYEIKIINSLNYVASFNVRFNHFKTLLANELNQLRNKYLTDKSLLAFRFENEGKYKKYNLKQLVENKDENGKEIYNAKFFDINSFIKVIDAKSKKRLFKSSDDIQVKIIKDSFKLQTETKNIASFTLNFYLSDNLERNLSLELRDVEII